MKPSNDTAAARGQRESMHGLDYDTVKSWHIPPLAESYTKEEVIAYARGIGVGMPGPLLQTDARFLSRGDDLQVLPMMAIILNQGPMWTKDPRTGIDWTKTVHAEESITVHRPLPLEATLVASYAVDEIYDKGAGKGALMYERRNLQLEDGTDLATVRIATFLRGNGGFGGTATGTPRPPKVPDERPADAVIDLATPTRDNTIFQLGGEFVEAVKSELLVAGKPMLRGVCSFGLAGRAVLKLTCDNQPERLRYLGLRYIAPVFADEVLRTEVWFLEPGRAAFRVSCTDRNKVVMDNGLVEYTPQ